MSDITFYEKTKKARFLQRHEDEIIETLNEIYTPCGVEYVAT